MEKKNFGESVEMLVEADDRYDADAYFFLREALTSTMNDQQRRNEDADPHVSGPELLDGFRQLALKRYGPMTYTVMEEWGVLSCEDVGAMVFKLIEADVFGKSETDSPEDFAGVFEFQEAFVEPFQPRRSGTKSKKVRMPSRRRKPESQTD